MTGGLIKTWPGRELAPEGAPSLDIAGKLVLPGLVDPHVHFRQPGGVVQEGIANGSRAALVGGVTTVLDMPNTIPPTNTPARFHHKRALFQAKSYVHWGVHMHADPGRRQDVPGTAASLKVYMAKSSALPAVTTVEELARLFRRYKRVAVHAEDETAFSSPGDEREPWRTHHEVRPLRAVTRALDKIEQALEALPRAERPRVILCHMATADEVAWLERMKHEQFDIWGETCPHYYLLDTTDVARLGSIAKVNPPIREAHHREAVLDGLRRGVVDFLGTDHAPHLYGDKLNPKKAPSGIAGIEAFALTASLLVDRFGLTVPQLQALTSTNAGRCYELDRRGSIQDGHPADLCVLDSPRAPRRVVTKAATHPYQGKRFSRSVFATFVAGRPAYVDGTYLSFAHGQEVYSQ